MDKIDLDKRDRGNIYREDADNVHALAVNAEDINTDELPEALVEAVEGMIRTGTRRAYVVIRIER